MVWRTSGEIPACPLLGSQTAVPIRPLCFLPNLAAQTDFLAHRAPGLPGQKRLPPATHHAVKHLPGHRKGDLVHLEELAVGGVPAPQDSLKPALG